MLNITYAPADVDIAERMKDDLSAANLRLDHDILLVIITENVSAESDGSVKQAIDDALDKEQIVLPIKMADAPLPDRIQGYHTLDLTDGYAANRLIGYVRRADIGQETRQQNMRYLLLFGAIVLVIFGISVGVLAAGVVGFPEDEFEEDQQRQLNQIQTLVYPTLDGLQPRSTQDTENFPSTLEAADEDIRDFLILTATAIPANRQATLEAQANAATATAQAAD